nr:hypothetical protein SPACI_41000 [Sporomusa acidovorans DSM 3132]
MPGSQYAGIGYGTAGNAGVALGVGCPLVREGVGCIYREVASGVSGAAEGDFAFVGEDKVARSR